MFTLYIIRSIVTGRYYVGVTNNLTERIAQHNAGLVRSTKNGKPYKLEHTETFPTLALARLQERRIKRAGHVARYLKNFSALSSNG